ncbi:hypothetical protein ACWERY_38820, partial [Streptomyces sp. NPDC004082]
MSPFEQIIDLLDREKAAYRVVEHAAEGRSEEVSAVRGTTVSQGAKALVCRVKGIDSPAVLAVLRHREGGGQGRPLRHDRHRCRLDRPRRPRPR